MIQPLKETSAGTRALAAYIAQAGALQLPAAVEEKARQHVLDTIAAMVSGARLAPGRIVIAYVRRLGGTRVTSVARSPVMTSAAHPALDTSMTTHAHSTDT